SLTVTVPDAVREQIQQTLAEVFGGRPRRPHSEHGGQRLSAERIVDVAIHQLRDRGYQAVSLPSSSRALPNGHSSLYAHVANKAELDQLVVGRVSSLWQVPEPDPACWGHQLSIALRDLLSVYRAHPGVARCTMGMVPTTPGALMSTERLLAILR